MDHFVFRYEKILQLRQDEEDQFKNQLALRLKEFHELQENLESLKQRLSGFVEEMELQAEEGCTIQYMRHAASEKNWMIESIENTEFLLELKEKEVEAARHELAEASKKRKIMEKLKENAYAEYTKETERSEELLTDQITTYSSTVKKREL